MHLSEQCNLARNAWSMTSFENFEITILRFGRFSRTFSAAAYFKSARFFEVFIGFLILYTIYISFPNVWEL